MDCSFTITKLQDELEYPEAILFTLIDEQHKQQVTQHLTCIHAVEFDHVKNNICNQIMGSK